MIPRVAFQGELSAFSELAKRQHWPNGATPAPRRTVSDAIASVRNGEAEYGVIPLENAGTRVVKRCELRVPIQPCSLNAASALRDIEDVPANWTRFLVISAST